jgi:hypothetical protein
MGFVADKVALQQVFLRVLQLSPVSIVPPWLSILNIPPEGRTIGPLVAAVQRHSHPINTDINMNPLYIST